MDADRARELLTRERLRVEGQLTGLDPDPEADNLHAAELEEGMAERLRDDLAAIERAEARLAAGTYGLSVESGDAIPDERLEVVPWAERTVEEQERLAR